jgi:hypothetical protein
MEKAEGKKLPYTAIGEEAMPGEQKEDVRISGETPGTRGLMMKKKINICVGFDVFTAVTMKTIHMHSSETSVHKTYTAPHPRA